MYVQYPKHIMEQLAFSFVLQRNTRLFSGEDEIGHYWSQKPEYQVRIDQFLQNAPSLAAALKAYPHFEHPAPPEKVEPKKKSFWPSWLRF
jgi:hypothetical protein